MAARPGDLRLDELLFFVDDSWNTGPRKITDYALLGGNMSAADALLAAGATPSLWMLALLQHYPDEARLKPVIVLLNEYGPVIVLLNEYGLALPVLLNTAILETAREFQGAPKP